jgi:predicted nucleic acid-binding protein
MRLVIDANILIAALLKDATTREILLEEDIEFSAPECLLLEIKNLLRNPKVRKRIKLSDNDLNELTSAIFNKVKFFPEQQFLSSIKKSIPLVTHIEDAPYIALSLRLGLPLWTNDAALKEQPVVVVITTLELVKLLKS